MTTTPVMTITDEQIAEIEAAAEINAYVTNPWRFEELATASTVSALISRLRAAEKDASRWRKCKTMNVAWWPKAVSEAGRCGGRSLDQAIDDAMEESE